MNTPHFFTPSSVAIVIVNWNSGPQLRQCLESIQAATEHISSHSTYVVDNASTDDSLAGVGDLPVTIIRNERNLGFAAACNQGAAAAIGFEYVLFLNPDTRLYPDSIRLPLQFMDRRENDHVGICGIQLLDERQRVSRTCARFPTVVKFALRILGLDRFPPLRSFGIRMTEWNHQTTTTVDQVMGAFFLVRRSLFESLRGFDERFFVYFEEVDFCLRARKAGWLSVYLADAYAFHAAGGTSKQIKARRLFYSMRSRLLYGFKHFSRLEARILVALTLLIEPFTRSILALLSGRLENVFDVFRGYAMLVDDLPGVLAKKQGCTSQVTED